MSREFMECSGGNEVKPVVGVRYVAFTIGENGQSWIVDSGASAHMSSDESFFTKLNKFLGGWITMANGQKTQNLGEGRGVLFGYNDCDNIVRIDMCVVKFVPGLATSLISVVKLADKNMSVSIGKDGCKIIDENGNTVVTGLRSGGLYTLRLAGAGGGGEFENKELRKFYKEEGIKPQFTTPYSPQQNGMVERKNRSITEMATCMLIDAGLEKRYWGEALLTATYLQNRLPSNSKPYEM